MTGDLAAEYARLTGSLDAIGKVPLGLEVSTIGQVSQRLGHGAYRIESSTSISKDKPRLVTIMATVDAGRIKSITTPKGRAYPSPNALEKGVDVEEGQQLRVELSNLKGVRLRRWSLTEEVGDSAAGGAGNASKRTLSKSIRKRAATGRHRSAVAGHLRDASKRQEGPTHVEHLGCCCPALQDPVRNCSALGCAGPAATAITLSPHCGSASTSGREDLAKTFVGT